MVRDYFSKLIENPLVKYWVGTSLMAVTLATGLFVGMDALRNTESMRNYRERNRELSAIVREVERESNERTKNCVLYDNQIGIDVDGDSTLDLVVGHMGARPGAIHYRKPTLEDQRIYRRFCL